MSAARTSSSHTSASRIAITGMACLFPGAPDLAQYWHNIVNGVDAISEVPPERWDASFYDPASTAVDRFYCRRGGFIDDYASFDPLAFGVMPRAVEAAEPDQLLVLRTGYDALRDAGLLDAAGQPLPGFARERSGVIIGRGNYVSAGVLRLEQHVRLLPQLMQTLQDLLPDLPAEALAQARERMSAQLPYYGPDVAAGLIPNLIASRLANRLDLHGPAYTVDAACASSLIALEQACQSLARGESDVMLVGGAHLSHDLTFWATFCQLGALSRRGVIAPLSAQADGILAGEGVGMIVLKRLADAEAAGDRIYAVIEGVGSSSDGRASSLVAPSAAGQQRAVERAWQDMPLARDNIGLVEAHGTGTPAGDEAELATMAAFFGPHEGSGERAVIGSVKSMIGHTMPAAGIAGLIKTALAIHHGVLPPTLHCEQPNPALAQTRFRALAKAEPWSLPREQRVAAVNAFGFGGINAHAVLRGVADDAVSPVQAASPAVAPSSIVLPSVDRPEVWLLSADTPEALLARLERGERDDVPVAARCRLAIVEPDDKKRALARKAVAAGKPWHGKQQIWFSPQGLLADGGKLALVFPGVDSTFAPQAADLAALTGQPLPPYCETLDPQQDLLPVVVGLLGFNRYCVDLLASLGIRADVMAGHSVGEWSAMLASGMMDQQLSDRTNAGLDFSAMQFPDVRFLAAACDASRLQAAMIGLDEIAISHDNCPHQAIVCGRQAAIEIVAARLREQGVFTQVLPIVSGFHSPLFAGHMDWYRDFFAAAQLQQPVLPVWSATTVAPFPPDEQGKRELALRHLLEPVRFRELTEALYADGCRVFVQPGTGSLPGFIDDTLSGRPHLALAMNQPARTGVQQLVNLCAALWVEGAAFDTRLLVAPSAAQSVANAASSANTVSSTGSASRAVRLSLGVPLLRINQPLRINEPLDVQWRGVAWPAAALTAENGLPAGDWLQPQPQDDPVQAALRGTLADIDRASRAVLALWQQYGAGQPALPSATTAWPELDVRLRRELDLAQTIPYVIDHCLYPQRADWPVLADRHPVVPMTMEVMLLREAAEESLPGWKVVEVSHIQAYNWLVVTRPLTVNLTLQSRPDGVIAAEIEGYFRAELRVAREWPSPQVALPALQAPRATAVTAQALYAERWMFHGQAYQGVAALGPIGANGIEGDLVVPAGKGALLDNMGQQAGYWVMEQPENCLAMPIGVDRIRFFGEEPQPGERLHNSVRIVQLDDLNCVSDHCLTDATGRVRIAIDGWRTRRYQMDAAFWLASRQLDCAMPSQALYVGAGRTAVLFSDHYDTAILRDYIARRYLTTSEMAVYDGLSPRRRRQWLSGRVAAKDAVRHRLWQQGAASVFPQEIVIDNDERGAPQLRNHVTTAVPPGWQVSLAHKDHYAVAIAGPGPLGIDIERIETQVESFIDLVFSAEERARLAARRDEDPAVVLTRGWVAKEVVGKALGTGLGGKLRAFVIEDCDGDVLTVNGWRVRTLRVDNVIIGWNEKASDT